MRAGQRKLSGEHKQDGVQPIPAAEVKNGNTPFNVTTELPVTPIPRAPDCPNRRWTEDINDLAFTSANIRVLQARALVLTVEYTFSSPTADGQVPAANVSCCRASDEPQKHSKRCAGALSQPAHRCRRSWLDTLSTRPSNLRRAPAFRGQACHASADRLSRRGR
jgi:hypothetical protein